MLLECVHTTQPQDLAVLVGLEDPLVLLGLEDPEQELV